MIVEIQVQVKGGEFVAAQKKQKPKKGKAGPVVTGGKPGKKKAGKKK